MFSFSRTMHRLIGSVSVCLLVVFLFVASAGTATRAYAADDFAQVDTIVQDMMALYDVPGVAVGLIKDGKVVYTQGYGVRNTQTQQPVTKNTLFAIGSVSKSFTALDIAQLVDAGKLNLDAPVTTYIPDFKLSDPQATKALTLRHLLSHTSGVPPFDDWYAVPAASRKQIVDDMAKIPLTAQPGQLWQYTNQNFVVAGYALEQVVGQSWEEYTREHIFAPLGMSTANFDVAELQKSADYASPHALDVLKGMQPIPFFTNLGPIGPAGSINANVLDMVKYAAFQLGDGSVGGTRLVSQQQLDAMHTQQIAIGGNSAETDVQPSGQQTQTVATGAPLPTNLGYGLAWLTEDYHGYKVVAHDGAIDGFTSYVALVPGTKDGVVLLTNAAATNGGILFVQAAQLQLVNWLLGVPSEPNLVDTLNKSTGGDPAQLKAMLLAARSYKADPDELAALSGTYSSVLGTLTVRAGDGKLYVQIEGQPEVELVPFAPGQYLINTYPVAGSVISFTRDAQGTITVYQNGVQIAQRLGQGVQQSEYKDPQGRFTVAIPPGLVPQSRGDLLLLISANPSAAFVLGAMPAAVSLDSAVKSFVQQLDPSFSLEPVGTQPLPPIGGVSWTQYLYQLPGDQVLGVAVAQQNNTSYFILVQARSADLQALTPTFQSLLLNFRITSAQEPVVPPGMPRTGEPAPWQDDAGSLAIFGALLCLAGLLLRRRTSAEHLR